MAAALGLNVAQLQADAASELVRARVEAQRAAALADGVRGTPAAFVGDTPLDLRDTDTLRDQITRRG